MSSTASDPIAPGAREFRTTHWSMVLHARGDSSGAQESLAKLCAAYWYPLYAFVRRQGHGPHDAQDLTQEFFARLLEKGWLCGVERERGRFRSWLLAAMKHFLAKEWRRAQTIKRGCKAALVSFDDESVEAAYRREPADLATAEMLYDRRWAMTLLNRVRARLREEFAKVGKLAQFAALEGTLTGGESSYTEIAVALQSTEGAVKVAVHRLRSRYRTLLRAEIAETVASEAEIDAELRELLAALSR